MYPPGFATWVEPDGRRDGLEGAHRPGHFRGVATVCLKLFNIVRPEIACFGQKDAQQVAVSSSSSATSTSRSSSASSPTVRDADGLALSSRNARLSPDERDARARDPAALATRDADAAREVLAARRLDVDYVESPTSTAPTLAVAVRVGRPG